jgi:cell division protein FtsN
MARNYGTKRSSRQKGSVPQQFLVISVTFLLGYLTATVFDIERISQWIKNQVLATQDLQQPSIKSEPKHTQIPAKPKFEFYTLLANEKARQQANKSSNGAENHATTNPARASATVAVAAAEAMTHAVQESSKKNTSSVNPAQKTIGINPLTAKSSKGVYLVQVASFKQRRDAEQMKGMLTLKGFDVNVVTISYAGANWFRVVVGPFTNRNLAQRAQFSLAKNERLRGMVIGG